MKYWARSSGRDAVASWLVLVSVYSAGCGGDDGEDLPTPEGFSGTGGLIGGSGVGGSERMTDKNKDKAKGSAAIGGKAGDGSQPGAAGLPSGTCANGVADTAPVIPTIWLVVDGSSSMDNPFAGDRTRWQTLRSTLMDSGGVVQSLQDVARFGLVIYAGSGTEPGQCVQLITVPPALNNHAAIAAEYPMVPVASGTPTDQALDYVVENLPVTNEGGSPDAMAGPVYVVLATDGQPNRGCGDLSGGGDAMVERNVVDVTRRGSDAGMQMYVISLAGDDRRLQSHLDEVAKVTRSKTPPFVPATQGELVSTFQRIVSGASCQIDLKGRVEPDAACSGKVKLNGKDLACDSEDGWRLVDFDTFQLTGSACSSFLSSASSVYAMFPCEVYRPD